TNVLNHCSNASIVCLTYMAPAFKQLQADKGVDTSFCSIHPTISGDRATATDDSELRSRAPSCQMPSPTSCRRWKTPSDSHRFVTPHDFAPCFFWRCLSGKEENGTELSLRCRFPEPIH